MCPDRVIARAHVSPYATADAAKPLATSIRSTNLSLSSPRLANPDAGDEERAHLVCTGPTMTAQVFVDQADLRRVTTTFVLATPESTPDDDGVGISLMPGVVVVTEEEHSATSTRITIDEESVRGAGWVPDEALGRSFRPTNIDPRTLPEDGRTHLGFVERQLLATPGGPPFATLDGSIVVQPMGKRKKGHTLVAASGRLGQHVYAVGWLPSKQIHPPKKGDVPAGVYGKIEAPQNLVDVPAGATLVGPEGNIVAMVHEPTELSCTADCDGPTPELTVMCVTKIPTRLRAP
jgi:hypothetical protein